MRLNEIRYYMHGYQFLDKEIQHLKESLEEYRKMNISGIGAQKLSDMPIHHENRSRVEDIAIERVMNITDLEEELDAKLRLRKAIESVYFYLHEPQRSIIEMRYFIIPQGKRKANWQEIAEEVSLSEIGCKKLDGKIVREIQLRLMESQYKKKQQTA